MSHLVNNKPENETRNTNGSHNDAIWLILGGLVAFIIFNHIVFPLAHNTPTLVTNQAYAQAQDSTPQLEVLWWYGYSSMAESYILVEGEIKNISTIELHNVTAVASFYTEDNTVVTTGERMVAHHNLLPGQTSPFSFYGNFNPAVSRIKLEFKLLRTGEKLNARMPYEYRVIPRTTSPPNEKRVKDANAKEGILQCNAGRPSLIWLTLGKPLPTFSTPEV